MAVKLNYKEAPDSRRRELGVEEAMAVPDAPLQSGAQLIRVPAQPSDRPGQQKWSGSAWPLMTRSG
jgi:hypothetical protein